MSTGLGPSTALRVVLGARGRSLRHALPVIVGLALAAGALSIAVVVAGLDTTQAARRIARDGADGIGLPTETADDVVVRSTRSFTTDDGTVTLVLLGGPELADIGLPGLSRLPSQGTVLVSTDRVAYMAEEDLQAWLPGPVTGRLPRGSTVAPDEAVIVAVVGAPAITSSGQYSVVDASRVMTAPSGDGDDLLAVVGAIVVLAPLTALAGSAVRITARRKEERDATLRLLGVSPRGLRALVVLETVAASVIAAVGGLGAVATTVAVTDSVRVAGRSAWSADLRIGPGAAGVVVVGTVAVAVAAALLGTRGPGTDPIQARRASPPDAVEPSRLAWCAVPAAVLVVLWASDPTEGQAVAGTATALAFAAVAVVRTGPLVTRSMAMAPRHLGAWLGSAPLVRRAQQGTRPVVPVALVLFGFAVAMTLLPGMAAGEDEAVDGADLVVAGQSIDLTSLADALVRTPGVSAVAAVGDAVVAIDGRSTAVVFVDACSDLGILDVRVTAGSCEVGAALTSGGRARTATVTLAPDPAAMVAEGPTVYGGRRVSGSVERLRGADDDMVIVVQPGVETLQRRVLVRTDGRPATAAAVRDLVADEPALSLADRSAERLARQRAGARTADQIASVAGGLLGLGALGAAYAGWGVALERRRDHVTLRAIGVRRHEVALAAVVAFVTPVLAAGTLALGLGLFVGLVGAEAAGIPIVIDARDMLGGVLLSASVVVATAVALAASSAALQPEPPPVT